MSSESKIEWTDATWNPVRGCTKVSPGCKHCYAETFAERWRGIKGHPFEQGFDLRLVPEKLDAPLRWRTPRRVFVNSMSDLFHDDVPDTFIEGVFGVMHVAAQHTFQILTKRAERMRAWLVGATAERCLAEYTILVGDGVIADESPQRRRDRSAAMPGGWTWPLTNVHVGVSVEDRRHGLPRIDILREAPAALRWLSIEPLLEDLGALDLRGIDWVVLGSESGRGARPMNEAWVRSVRDQCQAARVPFFYKQRVEGGRKVSLPMLDGRQWNEFPNGA